MKKQKTGNNGFTLAELLIVVAVIGVLVAISMPVFAGHLEKSRETVDLANVRSAYSEVMIRYVYLLNHFALESGFSIFTNGIFRPYVFCQIERRPCFRPTGIKTDVGNDFGNLSTGNAVLLCRLQMKYDTEY